MHLRRSDIEPIDPSLVPFIISMTDTLMYAAVAVLALLVYDTIVTMDKEANLIYFANRYVGILGAISSIAYFTLHANEALCNGFNWFTSLSNILLMRVLALYHQDKNLTACLRILFGLEAAFALGALIYTIIYMEIVLMVLALWKAAQHWKESANFSKSNLLVVLIQDQAIYFTLVIFCGIIGILSYQFNVQNTLLAYFLAALGNPAFSEAGERQVNGETGYRMTTMNSMRFS
ncbi:hypothetical protein DFH11DRAFT_1545318 [Phellopilus nigrolimitatus]|nr:hypothetical protein DFH11DRAFT_1545318 [Phellopilus nigrolimitatus]